jgi:putative holliday junction resolvase
MTLLHSIIIIQLSISYAWILLPRSTKGYCKVSRELQSRQNLPIHFALTKCQHSSFPLLLSSSVPPNDNSTPNRENLISLEDKIVYLSESSFQDSQQALIDAAAAVTQLTSIQLGVRSLGVDYGLVRTGLAISVGYNPEPLDIIEERDPIALIRNHLIPMAEAHRIQQWVVGLPRHANGTDAEQTHITRNFTRSLAQYSLARFGPKIPVLLWDERYTSKEAAARAHAKDPNRPLYSTLDAEAACIILETYYNENAVGVEFMTLKEEEQLPFLLDYERRVKEQAYLQQVILEDRERRMQFHKIDAMERAKKLEDEMRAAGTLGESNKKRKKNKKKMKKSNEPLKRQSTKWIIP